MANNITIPKTETESCHTSIKNPLLQYLFTTLLQNKCHNKSASQIPQIWHVTKFFNLHLWGKYTNIHATYEVALINNVARIDRQ